MEDLKVMKKNFTKLLSITLIAANVLSLSLQPAISTNANSNQKPVLSHKKMTLTTGQSKKIKLKNVSISKGNQVINLLLPLLLMEQYMPKRKVRLKSWQNIIKRPTAVLLQ